MAGIVVLDASALIALSTTKDVHHDWAVDFFVETAGAELCISTLTLAETLVHPTKASRVEQFLVNQLTLGLRAIAIKQDEAVELAHLRVSTGLKMPDAIVLHTALTQSAALATTDKTLATAADRLGVRVFQP